MRRVASRRRGGFLLEVLAGATLLGLAVTLVAALLGASLGERKAATRRRAALIELQNQMERQAAREWATLAPGEPSEIPLAPEVRKTLREPRLVMEVTQMERDLKRIRLELRWRGAGGMDEKPARLTTFVSPRARHWPGGRP